LSVDVDVYKDAVAGHQADIDCKEISERPFGNHNGRLIESFCEADGTRFQHRHAVSCDGFRCYQVMAFGSPDVFADTTLAAEIDHMQRSFVPAGTPPRTSSVIVTKPVREVVGNAVAWKLTFPKNKWFLRIKDTEGFDRWLMRPDMDIHLSVGVHEFQGDVDVYSKVVYENLRKHEEVDEPESLPEVPNARLVRSLSRSDKHVFQSAHAIFVAGGHGYVLRVTAPAGRLAAEWDNIVAIWQSFEPAPKASP